MLEIIYLGLILGSINSTIITVMIKFGIIEFAQIYTPKWMPFRCYSFCLPFWISIIECVSLCEFSSFGIHIMIVPFITPSITQLLMNENS